MKFEKLLLIDEGRINRSSDISVKLEYSSILLTKRKGIISKLIGWIKGEPNIATLLLRFNTKNTKSGSEHKVFIEIEPTNSYSKLMKADVKLFCDCADFKYRSAYKLGELDQLVRSRMLDNHLGIALTEPPTKGYKTTMICKHIYAVSSYLRNNFQSINVTY